MQYNDKFKPKIIRRYERIEHYLINFTTAAGRPLMKSMLVEKPPQKK